MDGVTEVVDVDDPYNDTDHRYDLLGGGKRIWKWRDGGRGERKGERVGEREEGGGRECN